MYFINSNFSGQYRVPLILSTCQSSKSSPNVIHTANLFHILQQSNSYCFVLSLTHIVYRVVVLNDQITITATWFTCFNISRLEHQILIVQKIFQLSNLISQEMWLSGFIPLNVTNAIALSPSEVKSLSWKIKHLI